MTDTWADRNRRVLIAEIGELVHALGGAAPEQGVHAAADVLGGPSTLDVLASVFSLSTFERAVIVACLGVELRAEVGEILARTSTAGVPTFRGLLAALPDGHFSATAPQAPLRAHRLVELRGGDDILQARLRLDERVLYHLLGVAAIDAAFLGVVEPLLGVRERVLPRAYEGCVDRLADVWGRQQAVPQLCGADLASMRAIAATAGEQVGASVHRMRAVDLPTSPSERELFRRLWEREAVLANRALVIELDAADSPEVARTLATFLDGVSGGVAVAARDPVPLVNHRTVRIDVDPLVGEDQIAVWQHELGLDAATVETALAPVLGQFRLGMTGIGAAASEVRAQVADGDTTPLGTLAWRACRSHARPRLDGLAQRVEGQASWDDLVLPADKLALLRSISAHVRHARTVYERWGFGGRGTRGLGVTALFAGASGTGKTMAAEILARELDLDLYKIDLSQMVSKYIGETEKNLRRIFDAAEECGALLLFDEADALFGKRSEVKDSHDRYANVEVSYLLQRMEQYRGLAVLTTNMRRSLDGAFLRRLRFVIEFPFPDAAQRAEIWRRAFPAATPVAALDHGWLARLNIPGGVIRTIALNAAFLAADAGEPVAMHHLQRAVRHEYQKLEKPYDGGP